MGILGPNGSGKTTLLRLLGGLLVPLRGRILLGAVDLRTKRRNAVARQIAIVPQETHLAFEYTVLEMALMGRYPHLGAFEVEGPADLAAARVALEATGTADLASRPFRTLSGGEKQRVMIASALAQLDDSEPAHAPILLLDEPTASLDLRYQLEVSALLRRLHDRRNVTIVLTTHDLRFAASLCTRVLLLSKGRLLAEGPPAGVLTPSRISELYEIEAGVASSVVSTDVRGWT